MKSYKCSQCKKLCDCDENCLCAAGIDPRPNHREKGDSELCKSNFEQIEPEKHWHEKFSWE